MTHMLLYFHKVETHFSALISGKQELWEAAEAVEFKNYRVIPFGMLRCQALLALRPPPLKIIISRLSLPPTHSLTDIVMHEVGRLHPITLIHYSTYAICSTYRSVYYSIVHIG